MSIAYGHSLWCRRSDKHLYMYACAALSIHVLSIYVCVGWMCACALTGVFMHVCVPVCVYVCLHMPTLMCIPSLQGSVGPAESGGREV